MRNALVLISLIALFLVGCQGQTTESGQGTTGAVANGSGGASGHVDSLNRTYHLKDLKRVKLTANGHDIQAWVMDTPGKQEEGMMWLTADDVADDDGMIFVFPEAADQNFWMKNTLLALDIIYISPDKKVLNIQKGQPQDDKTQLPSKGKAQYVLEMKQGSAARLGIVPGTIVTIPSDVIAK